jgi:hypothetical protein
VNKSSANGGFAQPTGGLAAVVTRAEDGRVEAFDLEQRFPLQLVTEREMKEITFSDIVRDGLPRFGLGREVNLFRLRNMRNLARGAWRVLGTAKANVASLYGVLYVDVVKADGRIVRYGMASTRVVTTAGVIKIVALMNASDASTGASFKYHAMGTTNTAESSADTALAAEVETRATGSQTTGGSTNVYRSVGTITATAGRSVVEHGILSASSTGTLLDRSVFSTITLANGDSIQFTYDLTIPAGG